MNKGTFNDIISIVMYRQYSFLLVFPLIFTFGILALFFMKESTETESNHQAINDIIGDESYLHVFGEYPDETVPEKIRIKTHLEYVEQLLRNRSVDHLTDAQNTNRAMHLKRLRSYIESGEFPVNDHHPDKRRPTFISDNGNVCAVGYLIKQELGAEIVKTINKKYKYAYISEIDDPELKNWAESSGFTIRELSMIQPAYGPAVVEEIEQNKNNIDLSYGIGSSLLTSANILYHTNRADNPWLFYDVSPNHWFGLTAGSASVLLGALNLNNNQSYTEPIGMDYGDTCGGFYCPPLRKVSATNRSRTVLSIANLGVGVITMFRSGYHLINGTGKKSSKTAIGVTQLDPDPIQSGVFVPAVHMRVRL